MSGILGVLFAGLIFFALGIILGHYTVHLPALLFDLPS